MRVISGLAKGNKLVTLDDFSIRPTTDRVKETLFNVLSFELSNCYFLDLYSGSGAIGIEAISRGAAHVIFVESQKTACDIIKKNLINTKLLHSAEIINDNVEVFLEKTNHNFDIIFLDPPYDDKNTCNVIDIILKKNLIKLDGQIVLEQKSDKDIYLQDNIYLFKIKYFKKTKLIFYKLR